jgi:hypothetical protein
MAILFVQSGARAEDDVAGTVLDAVGAAVSSSFTAASILAPDSVVIPNINETTPGPSNQAFPFNEGNMRYLQVFAADQFAGLAGVVTQFAYRVDEGTGEPFNAAGIDTEIRLSHTSVIPTGMSLSFADNVGPDETIVFDGLLFLQSDGSGAFDIVVDIDDVFVYNGIDNLLIEIKVFGPADTTQFDAAGTGLAEGGTPWTDRVWSTSGPDAATGSSGGDDGMVTQFTFAPASIDVELDIRPGSEVNPINPTSRGLVPVAILGSDTFDVADVDATTLAFGPEAAPLAHRNGPHPKDANHDDDTPDLLAHFLTDEAGIAFGDTEACVTGELLDGTPFEGCDAITTETPSGRRCGLGFELALLLAPLGWLYERHRRRLA